MSQRASAATAQQQAGAGQQAHVQALFPSEHHLMPQALRKIPVWYEDGPFRYNLRMWVGFLPGALLVSTVTGKLMVGVTIIGILVALITRSMGLKWPAMAFTIALSFVLEVLNVYCMVPLIWRSVLNLPLFLLFHVFIAVSSVWWWLQNEEFRNQDPRFIILVERLMFYLYPALSVTMVTWICGMLFGSVLPYAVCIAGLVAISLYVTPLQSSFAKSQTPTDTGLIQHRAVAWIYIVLELCVPALLYVAINYTPSLRSMMTLGLFVVGPPFLLTLLEAQGLFYWMGLGPRPVQIIRWISGITVLALFSLLVYTSRPSSFLPLLLIPTLYTQLGLVSAIEHAPSSHSTIALSIALALLYSAAFTLLPWSISHYFSFLSLPLSMVQLVLWGLAMAVIAMVLLWRKMSSQLWAIYCTVFVFCEYLLSWDGVYPPYVAMATGTAAVILFWRLHSVGQLSLNACLLSICLHLTKLSLLLPSSLPTSIPSTLTTVVSVFLVSFVLLRVMVFEGLSTSLSQSQILVYSGLLLVGLLLSVDSVLSPLWASLTHHLPSTANLVATVLAVVGVFLSHGLALAHPRDKAALLGYLPPALFVMTMLLTILQPEFNLKELIQSVNVVVAEIGGGDSPPLPDDIILAAWSNLVIWLTFIATLAVLCALATSSRPLLITTTACLLGALLGVLAAIGLVHSFPASLHGLLYAVACSTTATLLGRAYCAKHGGQPLDVLLFLLFLASFVLSFYTEWTTIPRQYTPWTSWISSHSLPCAKLFMLAAAAIASTFRAKMHYSRDQPYLPLMTNSCCLLFFLLSLLSPLHSQLEVSTVLSSCVFLLAQPDSLLLPPTNTLFLAPSLLASVTALYCIATALILPRVPIMIKQAPRLFLAARGMELLCLAASIPGQAIFLYYLWTGRQLKLSVTYLLLYILPNALLPQFASSTASTLLGSIGVLSFCLIMVGDYANLRIL